MRNGSTNDPTDPQLLVENADRTPVYVRFQPIGREDNWNLARAVVTLNNQPFPQCDSAEIINSMNGIWLGVHSGLVVHLPKHSN